MATRISPLAGQPAPAASLVDISKLVTAYYIEVPDPSVPGQRIRQSRRRARRGACEPRAEGPPGRAVTAWVASTALAGEEIQSILNHAPGNGAPIGGIKVSAASGWFAARPSGTEDTYKIYAEGFAGPQHLQRVLEEAQGIGDAVISNPSGSGAG